jgi:hypothetical protein
MTAQAPAYIGEGAYGTSRCYDSIDPTTEKVIAAVADCSASANDTRYGLYDYIFSTITEPDDGQAHGA